MVNIKIKMFLWMKLFSIILFFIWISCSDNNLSHVCSDPEGSEDITISRCNGLDNWDRCYFCFGGEKINNTDTCLFNNCFKLYAASKDSSWIFWSWYFTGGCTYGTIADVGSVSCLGDVKSKPLLPRFGYQVTPQSGHGYVVSFPDGTYGRFFIQGILKNSAGRDTSVYMTRQYPF